MTIFDQISTRIIKEQELIIGPLAWSEAGKVDGLIVDAKARSVSFTAESKEVIDRLVTRYEFLFGRASHEVCREAVQDLLAELPADQVPSSLK
jgi:hypothetical protein